MLNGGEKERMITKAAMIERETLDTMEAAQILQLSVHTLRAWLAVNKHNIHSVAYKVGGKWLFFRQELEDWIREHPGDVDET